MVSSANAVTVSETAMPPRPLDLMIGGAQKAATSSLKAYLGQHPQVCTHAEREFTCFINDELHRRGYEAIYPDFFPPAGPEQRLLAKSVGVMHLPEAADRLHAHNPDMTVLFLLRHPVDRAYSAYWFARRKGWEPADTFEAALDAGPERFAGDWVRQRNCAYLERSAYVEPIRRFRDRFGEERVMVFLLDDLKRDAAAVCRSVFEAMGVDPSFEPDLHARRNAAAEAYSPQVARMLASRNPLKRALRRVLPGVAPRLKKAVQRFNERSFEPPPMAPETRARLIEHFRAHNDELAALLGRDLEHWIRP